MREAIENSGSFGEPNYPRSSVGISYILRCHQTLPRLARLPKSLSSLGAVTAGMELAWQS